MRYPTATAILAITATLATAGTVEAKARVKPHRPAARAGRASANGQLATALAEIREQKGEIEQLKALVAQQSAAVAALQNQSASTAQTASAAAAKADQAQNTAIAAQTQSNAVATQAQAPQAPAAQGGTGNALARLASNTQFRALAFFNESNIHQTSNGKPVATDGTGFNVKRMYIGVDHQFNSVFSASVLADVRNVVGSSSYGNNSVDTASTPLTPAARAFYLKNAYLQIALSPAFTIRAGAAPEPWIPYIENLYGYRYVENTLVDRVKLGNTADWGIHVLGNLADGIISYQVSAVNGAGYSDVNVTKYVDLEGRLSAQYKGFFAAVGGYDGHLGKSASVTTNISGTAITTTGVFVPVYQSARRIDFAGGYKSSLFTLGGEYYYAKDYQSVTSATQQDTSRGYSVFANVNFAPKWAVFGRYDWVRNVANTSKPVSVYDHFFNVGVQWEPIKLIDLSLIYKREAVDNGTITTQDGTIGGALNSNGIASEFGLYGQFKF